jgi:hypothetical protein
MNNIIYIKYGSWNHELINPQDFVHLLEEQFKNYNWGAGFKVANFRFDERHFYADLESAIYFDTSDVFSHTKLYIQGVLSGFLMAFGVEIL